MPSINKSFHFQLLSTFLIIIGILVLISAGLQTSMISVGVKESLSNNEALLQASLKSNIKKLPHQEIPGQHSGHKTDLNNIISDSYSQIAETYSQDQIAVEYPKPKNVILFIGDGMGEEHLKATRWFSGGINGRLAMDELTDSGFILTFSADNQITDSAAAATAISTGVKTNNGVIGLDTRLNFVPTILEQAKLQGKSVGLVTTTMVSHATPAAFAAHVENRYLMNEIANQIMTSDVDVILGGGEDEFYPTNETGCFPEVGERMDGKNLIQEALALGYIYICDPISFQQIDPSSSTQIIGLFADEGMTRPYSPTLAEMTNKAIEVLSHNPNGFFLMVEGGQIDWTSHENNALATIQTTIYFDEAVRSALENSDIRDDTLIIVTADHETGGMITSLNSLGLVGEDGPFEMPDGTSFYVNWSTKNHTAAPVPIKASGPLSHWINGVHDNTYVYDLISSAISGIKDFDSIFLPADIDGDGVVDHPMVCPWNGNWYIEDDERGAPLVINPPESKTDIPIPGWGD